MKKFNKILAVILFACSALVAAFALSGCGYCQHKLDEVVPATASTCMTQGYKKAYKCVKCKQLFSYDRVHNKLYEIDKQEKADFAPHTVSGELVGAMNEGAENFADFHVENVCGVCGETFTVDRENLFHAVASDNCTEHKLETSGDVGKETYTYYSQFTLPADSEASEDTPLFTCQSNGNTDRRVNVNIPYTKGVDRHCIVFFRNNSDIDVDVSYGAENVRELCLTEKVTVPAGGYAAAPFTINFSVTASSCWTRLYLLSDIDREVKLDMCSYYYDADTKLEQTTFSQVGPTGFIEGQKIDPDNLIFREVYAGGGVRIHTGREAKSDMYNRALTVDDSVVELVYNGKKYNYNISVATSKRTLTILGAQFADGTHSKLVRYDADQPNDIVFKDNAIFLYWTDIYGERVPYGFNMEGNSRTLRAVYAGENQTNFDVPVDYGTNYALNKPVESSSVYLGENSAWRISQLTDGKRTYPNGVHIAAQTDQSHEKDDDAWFKVDLGEMTTFNEVHLYGRADGVYFPSGYYIDVSEDGESWTTVFVNEHDVHSTDKTFLKPRMCFFDSVTARYLRITSTDLTSAGSGYYFALAELEVYNV